MQNKSEKSEVVRESHLKMTAVRAERRKKSRSQDFLYRATVALNLIAWTLLVIALIVFHYARPEFITGLQNYWGIDGRDFWLKDKLSWLLLLLETCLLLSFFTLIIRARRNRRKSDQFGINLLVLLLISLISLITIYTVV
jgi:cation transport ATPase